MASQASQVYEIIHALIGPFIPFLIPINFYINLHFLSHKKWKTSIASKVVNISNIVQLLSRSGPRITMMLWGKNIEEGWTAWMETGLIFLFLVIWGIGWDFDGGLVNGMLDDWWSAFDGGEGERKVEEAMSRESEKGEVGVKNPGNESSDL